MCIVAFSLRRPQSFLTTLVAKQSPEKRMQILALSAVACAALLQPAALGLPEEVEGIPFLMALIIGQIVITGFMLCVTAYQVMLVGDVGKRTEDFCKARRRKLVDEWRSAFEIKRQIEGQLSGGVIQTSAGATFTSVAPIATTHKIAPSSAKDMHLSSLPPSSPTELMTRAVLSLPALIHHAVQSTHGKPTHPSGQGAMGGTDWIDPKDKQLLDRSQKIDDRLSLVLQFAYFAMWFALFMIYFIV